MDRHDWLSEGRVRWKAIFEQAGMDPLKFYCGMRRAETPRSGFFLSWPDDERHHDTTTIRMSQGGISATSLVFPNWGLKIRINIAVEEEVNPQIIKTANNPA